MQGRIKYTKIKVLTVEYHWKTIRLNKRFNIERNLTVYIPWRNIRIEQHDRKPRRHIYFSITHCASFNCVLSQSTFDC